MPSITEPSGYALEPLREGVDFTLYRGRRRANVASVLAVALSAEHPSPQGLRRLEHEYSLAAELDPAWAAKPVALTRHEGRMILVLMDPGGEPLDLVQKQRQLDLSRLLRIAVGLTKALGQVHRHGLIHKDVKLANVLVDEADNVWLTGFGIASQLPRESQAPVPLEIIAGTLAYMAPEQTGRMNRSIDTRSDLYSLGVTLYQMFTGDLPFSAADPLEWVHCHIARQPVPPADRAAVPEPLSGIIMKLLAKSAEARYQTASGLEADLRRCLTEWESHGRIDPFPLGAHDVSDRLLIPEKLYGREREIGALLGAFDRVLAQGTAELVLVSGYSGVGKSSVVNELHKALVPPRGLFASGKFDQYKRDIPYTTLGQAFQALIRQILVKSDAEVNHWRHALQEALGVNGQLVVNLVPEVEFIIGKQPPVPDLPPQEARTRFQFVFRRFLGAFARPEHPLALFLDDLQWLDAATLELLEHLITHQEVRHLMLVGAYRDNEVSSSHPLMRTIEAIRKTGSRIEEIVLSPLGLDDVGRLVTDALRCEGDSGHPLAQLVHEKTGGNPFFAIQFLTALAEEGLLRRDSDATAPNKSNWTWDLARIRAHGYTDNVVDLMVEKLKRLPGATQAALQQLACLGNVAEIATLRVVFGQSQEETHTALLDAARAGLIFRLEGAYAFLHDRIQEAAYALIPESALAQVHLRIGRALLVRLTADDLGEHLFDIANQLNRGAALLIERNEKARVATIDLRAGRKAKASAAYAAARAYFSAGMALLDESDWSSQYELTFSLWLERAECELSGNFETIDQLIRELLQRGRSKVDRAAAYRLKIQLHILRGEYPQAVANALACLTLLGIDLPEHPTPEQVQAEYETVWQVLNGRPIESLIDLPLMTDAELLAATHILSVLALAVYYTDIPSFCLMACRLLRVTIQHGVSGNSLAFVIPGLMLGPVFHRYADGDRFARLACQLVEKHGFTAIRARIYTSVGAIAAWTQPVGSAIDFNRTAFRAAMDMGDLTYICLTMTLSVTYLLLRNDPLEAVWRESEMALDFARKAKNGHVVDVVQGQQRFIANMLGRTATFSSFSDAQFDEAAFETQLRMPALILGYSKLKLVARYLSGDYREALAAASKAEPLLSSALGQIHPLDYFYYTALTVAALFEQASADEQQSWRNLLAVHREQLREWAENNPPTFADKHALLSAEIARLEGRDLDAMRLYDQAIQSAREHGFVQNEGVGHEVAARFYASRGFEAISHMYLRSARYCYDRWGAVGKVKQLDERYPSLREQRDSASPTATIGTPVGQLDVETIVRASQALSSEMVLDKLIEKLMRIALEHAGAARGLLILLRGEEPRIEAEARNGDGKVEVAVRQAAVTPSDLPQSALQYVIRTQERVLLDDASITNLYSQDPYVRTKAPRSVLCLPIVQQTKLIGILYVENNLTPRAFTSNRVAVLELLASQASISLENAGLYSDLQRNEAYLAQGQSISHTGSFGWNVLSGEIFWSEETHEMFELDRRVKPTLELVFQRFHPADRGRIQQALDHAIHENIAFDLEHRLLLPSGGVKHIHVLARALKTSRGDLEYVGAVTDVTAAKQAEMKLRESEAYLAEAQRLSHTGSWAWNPATGENRYWSDECFRLMGFDPADGMPPFETVAQRFHPDDQPIFAEKLERASRERAEFEVDYRIIHPDGEIRDIHAVGHPVPGPSGDLEFVGSVIDVTERKQAEENIRQSERELRQILDLSPQHIAEFGPDGSRLYANQATLDYFGLSFEEWRDGDRRRLYHPEDWERTRSQNQDKFSSGHPHEAEARLLGKDGKYRWFLDRWSPLRDEQGRLRRWHLAGTDIEDRKQAEQRLQIENVALREEIDHASMFEQIVGASPPLRSVLSRISKVAPTDSSVLITGKTGTGKELVARAIHKRSRRASRPFVSVNCAAIPRDLIASELFGHEKGAFTGATQRRLGRFELAEGGTIFLDEVGELPAETQIALLRVLQEREFERVGAAGSIRTNVRVIAATNRDLDAAIAAGTFRSDLFYRLNVFPIEMPSLRERREDIPLLVEYFIDRFARQAGKSFQAVNKKSLDLLQSYPWPGNIRELQNVIERSVIVCETENFSVDESWLSRQPPATEPNPEHGLFNKRPRAEEKAIIEAALSECGGRVYGPTGAAAKLGIPRSTLEHKIRSLQIDKKRF